jgi:ABC-type branched-subunit amino acid transport system substrate-binding protein
MNRTRKYDAWPGLLDEPAKLADKTIGIIRTDIPADEAAVDQSLKPAIEDLGYEVAAEAVLPCPDGSQNCSQHDAAIQRMQSAGVDFIFLTAQTLAGSATVEAAENLNYEPDWATAGNNITKTVAQFFVNAKDNWDGAWGLDTTFTNFSDSAKACNKTVADAGGDEFPEGSDGFGFAANTCRQIQVLAEAIDGVDGAITQAKVIAAIEDQPEIELISGPSGSLSKKKHDAGDYVFLSRYSAASGEFEPVDDRKPLKVP